MTAMEYKDLRERLEADLTPEQLARLLEIKEPSNAAWDTPLLDHIPNRVFFAYKKEGRIGKNHGKCGGFTLK